MTGADTESEIDIDENGSECWTWGDGQTRGTMGRRGVVDVV